MGIQSMQDFIDSSVTYSIQLPKYLEESKLKTSNLLLVHADSCVRQFYHEHVDWVCGGQWNELLQSIDRFVRAFRQFDIELVVFFDGSLNEASLHSWSSKHRFYRDIVRETLSHVINNQNVPFRTKTKNFVAPGALKSAIRLAFRSLDVMVCCSLEDIYKESVLFGKDENCLGIIANDANFFICNIPRYINLGNTRWLKKIFSACKVYNFENILKELNLDVELLPYLAALLGNFMINDSSLSSFYWELIEEDHPLKKIQEHVVHEAVLPPSEVRLKCVAKFLHNKHNELDDIDSLAQIVFGKSSNVSVVDGAEKLKKVIQYYKDILHASNSPVFQYEDKDASGLSAAGYPLPSNSSRYKQLWQYMDKSKQVPATSVPTPKPKVVAEEIKSKDTVENPEEVIKQGTLEEAAQALIQLELNEESNAKKSGEEEKLNASSSDEVILENGVVENDEKPSILSEQDIHSDKTSPYCREIKVKPVLEVISEEVLKVARKRHQSGQMCPEILNLLTKGEIILDVAVDDEATTQRLSIPLIFRPLRQLIYGVLFGVKKTEPEVALVLEENKETANDVKSHEVDGAKSKPTESIVNGDEKAETSVEEKDALASTSPDTEITLKDEEKSSDESSPSIMVKEWCIYGVKRLDEPDNVEAKGMNWGVPPLKKLWFGMESEDNANRLKAFLSCMKSDTVNMSNTAMVPQRLMLLCCVLRYLIQQEEGKAILTKQDIDAFLAQALSTQLTMEHNTQNLANIKLSHIDARCIQLAAIFMSGIENAIIANDACGSPVPWEFCCPWNFFDGKLFHSKWLMSTMNANTTDLCDGKHHIAEKLERLRWCIVEGLDSKFSIAGLGGQKFFNPFGVPITVNSAPFHGVMRPGGSYPPTQVRTRSRGAGSRRTVHGSGGTLHVAGVPVAHWHGNKAGVGYSKNGPGVLVGGPNSVDLPSSHRRGRGRGARVNRGRGLLQTPFISPWQQGFGFEEYVNNTYQKYMKGVTKAEQFRAKISKMNRYQVYSSRTRNQFQNNQSKQRGGTNVNTSWFGKGRGQTKQTNNIPVKQIAVGEPAFGRGQWINAGE